jgi:hypothetical protein
MIDRYALNDWLSALAADQDIILTDNDLNELVHYVADFIEAHGWDANHDGDDA